MINKNVFETISKFSSVRNTIQENEALGLRFKQ